MSYGENEREKLIILGGGTPRKISKLEIGHSSVRMVDRYTHFNPEQRKTAAEKLAV